ncbi:Hypothetical predicted protein, partial [Paramuricea clavata]
NIISNPTNTEDLSFKNLEQFEVEDALKNFNVKKSTGWDAMSPNIFKLGAKQLSGLLISFCNACTDNSKWPIEWKKAEWIPIYKKDDPQEKKNHR